MALNLCKTLTFLTLSFLPALATAAVQANVSRTEMTVEDQLSYQIIVQGRQGGTPDVAVIQNFEVYSRGQSTQMQVINGQVNSSITYNYILVPKREGTLAIPEVPIQFGNTVAKTQAITIRVLPPNTKPKSEKPVFLEVVVSNKKPYINQPITYTWRIYRRVRLTNADANLPEFEGFIVEETREQNDYTTNVGGNRYEVSEIKKILIPQEAGQFELPSSSVTVDLMANSSGRRPRGDIFDDFFGRTKTIRKVLRSDPIRIEVQALPTPAEDSSGLVGTASIKSRVTKSNVLVGESLTLTIRIQAEGNWKSVKAPTIDITDKFKVYSDKPVHHELEPENSPRGIIDFSMALVPIQAGTVTIAAIPFTFFNPEKAAYETIMTTSHQLTIRPAAQKESLSLTDKTTQNGSQNSKKRIEVLGEDILPIYRQPDALDPPINFRKPLWFVALITPWLLFMGIKSRKNHLDLLATDVGLKRKKEAYRNATQSLHNINVSAPNSVQIQEFARLLKEYLGHHFNVTGGALTRSEIASTLALSPIKAEVIEQTLKLLGVAEALEYAGPCSSSSSSESFDLKSSKALLNQLEKSLQEA